MRVLVQRVQAGRVTSGGRILAEIGSGMVILIGVGGQDTGAIADYLAEKTANLRIFEDSAGKTNLSILDVSGEAIVVSQFTLYADTRKGRRPSFIGAAGPEMARPLVARFAVRSQLLGGVDRPAGLALAKHALAERPLLVGGGLGRCLGRQRHFSSAI